MRYSQHLTNPFDFRQRRDGWQRSEPFYGDLGYSLPLPWPTTTTAGWWNAGGIPEEKVLILSDQPEWNAVNDVVRSNKGLPEINTSDPIYSYQRSDKTIYLDGHGQTRVKNV